MGKRKGGGREKEEEGIKSREKGRRDGREREKEGIKEKEKEGEMGRYGRKRNKGEREKEERREGKDFILSSLYRKIQNIGES